MNVDEVLKYEDKHLKDNLKTKPNENFENDQKKKKQKAMSENQLSNLNDNEKLQILKMLENEPEGIIVGE
jgi:hypothetical protein